MVRTADAADDFVFIMTCLKHTSGMPKPDFEQVAKELGANGKNACYHRHWGIMKKWGLTGTSGRGGRPANTTPDSGQKKRRAATKTVSAEDNDEEEELDDSEDAPSERKKGKVDAPADVASKAKAKEFEEAEEEEADELA